MASSMAMYMDCLEHTSGWNHCQFDTVIVHPNTNMKRYIYYTTGQKQIPKLHAFTHYIPAQLRHNQKMKQQRWSPRDDWSESG